METWLPTDRFEGYYEVSDCGRVQSVDRVVVKINGQRCNYKGRVLSPSFDSKGRAFVVLAVCGRLTTCKVHTLVLRTFVGPPPDGMVGCHWNDIPSDNRLGNLRWDTRRSNGLDAVRNGRNEKSNRTECPREHLLIQPNLVPWHLREGHRACLACLQTHSFVRNRTLAGSYVPDFHEEADRRYMLIMSRVSA